MLCLVLSTCVIGKTGANGDGGIRSDYARGFQFHFVSRTFNISQFSFVPSNPSLLSDVVNPVQKR